MAKALHVRMSESPPSPRESAQLSPEAEAVESRVQLLEPSDLETLRVACTWRTSLMTLDMQKLETLAACEELREYVKALCIEDDFLCFDDGGNEAETVAPGISNIWPRDGNGQVIRQALGLKRLQSMLLARHLCPDKIQICDHRTNRAPSDPEVAAALARDIFEGADLAMTSISIRKDRHSTTVITADFDAQRQGQRMGLSLLHRADMLLNRNFSSYWATQILHHAPAIEVLQLSFCDSARTQDWYYPLVSPIMPLPQLQRLEIAIAQLSAKTIMAILANSRQSLIGISLRTMTLTRGSTWRELLGYIGREYPRLTSFTLAGLAEAPAGERKVIRYRGLNEESVDERYRMGLELLRKPRVADRVVRGVRFEGDGGGNVLQSIAAFAASEPNYELSASDLLPAQNAS